MPRRLRDVGLDRAALAAIADHTMDDWSLTRLRRPAAREDLLHVLEAAW
jgi:alcohol dehydrogenase class IV